MILQGLRRAIGEKLPTLFFLVFAAVCIRSDVSFSKSDQYSTNYIIESLKKIAFSAEFNQGDEAGYIRKWQDRVDYIILGVPDNKKIEYIIRFIGNLSNNIACLSG